MAFLTAEFVAAASAAISTGSSIASSGVGGMIDSTGYSVACGIEIENYTAWPLVEALGHNHGGYIKEPPTNIFPGKKEVFITHKNNGTATGSYGTSSWKVNIGEDADPQYLIVMWSAPFNFNHHSNTLAVGITKERAKAKNVNLFSEMYYDAEVEFTRKSYYQSTETIVFDNNKHLSLMGTMGTSHKPKVTIQVFPKTAENLAKEIKDNIKNNE